MPYQRQTREVFFKGRPALDPSKQMYGEIKEQEKVDNAFIKDMEKAGRDYRDALIAWDKNQATLDKEKVDFWKQVSPTMTKLVGETLQQGLEIKKRKDIENERESYAKLKPEEKIQLKKDVQSLVNRRDEITNKRESIAQQARSLGLHTYADYVEGLNKTELTSLHLNIMKEGLPAFNGQLNTALTSDREFGSGDSAFKGKDASTYDQMELIAQTLEDDYRAAANVAGIDQKIISAVVGDRLTELKQNWLLTQSTKAVNERSNTKIIEAGVDLTAALSAFNHEDLNDDPADFQGKLNNIITTLAGHYNAKGNPNPMSEARQKVKEMLQHWYATSADKELAKEKINAILHGSDGKILIHGHKGYPKGVSLAQLDGTRFNPNNFWKSTDADIASGALGIGGVDQNAINTKKWDFGWETSSDKPEDIAQTQKHKWDQAIKNGTPPSREEVMEYYHKASNYGVYPSTLQEIAEYADGTVRIYNAKETTRLLRDLKNTYGNEIQKDLPILKLLDEKTLDEWMKKEGVVLVDTLYGEGDGGNAVTESENDLRKAISPGNTPWTVEKENLLNELEAKVKSRVRARMYPEGEVGKDAPAEEPPNEATIIAEETQLVLEEFNDQKVTKGHRYYQGEDGNYAGLKLNKYWGPHAREQKKLEMQILTRNIKNDHTENFVEGGEPTSKRKLFFTPTALVNFYDSAHTTHPRNGTKTYTGNLPPEFIKAALEAGENPWVFYNNQVALANKGKPQSEHLPTLEQPEGAKAWSGIFNNNELKSLINILDDGTGKSSFIKPNVAAARIIDQKLNKLQIQNGIEPTPSEGQIINAVQTQSGGDYKYRSGDNLGKYNIPMETVQALYATKSINKEWTGPEAFLNDPALQDKIARLYVKSLIAQVSRRTPTKTYGRSKTEVRKNGALMIRDVLNQWTGADPNDPNTKLQNTLILNAYYKRLGGD